jgi:arsenite methyltransferase
MKQYLQKIYDWNRADLVSQYDELPLWSSPFGLLLLDNFPLGKYSYYLDIGSGTGFPLIDISQRIGSNCKSFGIDPWKTAVNRAQSKIRTLGLINITMLEGTASKLPFPDSHFDLITSNLGINNFSNPFEVLSECKRVMKPNGTLCLTTNLTGQFKQFYDIFNETLKDLGYSKNYQEKLEAHIGHRGTIESHTSFLKTIGFKIQKIVESDYAMRFFNGTSFLNHSVIISGFMDPWRSMFDESEKTVFFDKLEYSLNKYSESNGELKLTIPMVYFECVKSNNTFSNL